MMSPEIYFNHKEKFDYIETEVIKKLKDYPNFDHLDFSKNYNGNIHIRCFHKQIKGYSFGNHIEFKLDNDDYKEAVDIIVEMWKEYDNETYVKSYKRFIKDGERYGWD